MARLLLLRHGQSTWNAGGRWQGWADPPLSEEGERQARAAAALLAGTGVDRVITSDLRRARRTGELVAEGLGLGPVEVEPGLRERDVGDWSGWTTAEIEARWPGQLAAWRAGALDRPPNGESQEELAERVIAAVRRLEAREGCLLVVTHGGVIHLVERYLGGEASGFGNLCGRWIEPGLVPGDLVTVPSGDETTTVL